MSDQNQYSTSKAFKMAPSMKIGHVSLNVSNLKRSREFYHQILGFKVVSKSGTRALFSASGESGSYLVELVQAKADTSRDTLRPSTSHNTSGLYHFAILLPERKHLANMLLNLYANQDAVHFDGFADHLVSESIYIRDPDFNGIEIYRDRPPSEWIWHGNQIAMATLPLNTGELTKESTGRERNEMPPGTTIGHIHLHVRNISESTRFYHDILGLNLTATIPGAAFFAAGRYHHHIATNTWLGTEISPASSNRIGLNHFSIVLPNKTEFERLTNQSSQYGQNVTFSGNSAFVHDPDGIQIQLECN